MKIFALAFLCFLSTQQAFAEDQPLQTFRYENFDAAKYEAYVRELPLRLESSKKYSGSLSNATGPLAQEYRSAQIMRFKACGIAIVESAVSRAMDTIPGVSLINHSATMLDHRDFAIRFLKNPDTQNNPLGTAIVVGFGGAANYVIGGLLGVIETAGAGDESQVGNLANIPARGALVGSIAYSASRYTENFHYGPKGYCTIARAREEIAYRGFAKHLGDFQQRIPGNKGVLGETIQPSPSYIAD